MDPNTVCIRCSRNKTQQKAFSCGHSLCFPCTAKCIFFNHFKQLSTQDQIQIKCKCYSGTLDVSLSDIRQILSCSDPSHTCIPHNSVAHKHCIYCEKWLCLQCIEIHQEIFPQHQLTVDLLKCQHHEGQFKDIYCHNCQENICNLCTLPNEFHYEHNFQPVNAYADELRSQIPMKDISAYINQNEHVSVKFNDKLLSTLDLTIEKFDQLIKQIQEYKVIYTNRMNQVFERVDVFTSLIQYIYSSFQECESMLDINFLKELSTLDFFEISRFDMIPDKAESKLEKLIEEMKELIGNGATITSKHPNIVWNRRSFTNSLTLTGHSQYIYSLLQLKDGRIISGSWDNTIKIWEKSENDFRNTLTITPHSDHVSCLLQMKDGRIASGSRDKTIKIWEISEYTLSNTLILTGHTNYVYGLCQLLDGRLLSGSKDNTIKVWEVNQNYFRDLLTLTGHTAPIRTIIQLKDGRIASGSDDSTIQIWVIREKDILNTASLTGHTSCVNSIIQMKDGRIASGSDDKTIKIWELSGNDYITAMTLQGHTHYILAIIQLKDGRIVSSSADSTIRVWDLDTEGSEKSEVLLGHSSYVCPLILLNDGSFASGSEDKTIKIWSY